MFVVFYENSPFTFRTLISVISFFTEYKSTVKINFSEGHGFQLTLQKNRQISRCAGVRGFTS